VRQRLSIGSLGGERVAHVERPLPGVHALHPVAIHGEQVVKQIGARPIVVGHENGGGQHDPSNLCNTGAC
jgi:hypothetical protein